MRIIDTTEQVLQKAKEFINKLNIDDQIYIFGTNKFGLELAIFFDKKGFKIEGFVDDFTTNKTYDSYKIFKTSDLTIRSKVINSVIEGKVIEVQKHINKLQIADHCDYFSVQKLFPKDLKTPTYFDENNSINSNLDKYNTIINLLNDQVSIIEFVRITNFRLSSDIENLKDFIFKPEQQYFEDFINLKMDPVFVDGGGFDGLTSIEFMKRNPSYKKIHYFEPNDISMVNSKKSLISFNNIVFYNYGLWNCKKTLKFNSNLGDASKIDDFGELSILVTSLDNEINERIDFIKLDIEGAELEALEGAKHLITKHKPKIAVCVYHNQNHFIDIPNYLLKLNPDYKMYFRHYTQGVCESVMYFV